MKTLYSLSAPNTKGIKLEHSEGVSYKAFFGMPCGDDKAFKEAAGVYLLDTDMGRFEADLLSAEIISAGESAIKVRLTDKYGLFAVDMLISKDNETGVFSLKHSVTNLDSHRHTIYSCVPRIPLQGDGYELYAQSSGWCMENDGAWRDVGAGTPELGNSEGRSANGCTPFACIRNKQTGLAAAVHVLPIGDWVIRAKRVAGAGTAYTVLEAGLSDHGLRMDIAPGERLEMPEILLYGFEGGPESGTEQFHRYLLGRYPNISCTEPVYNTWFFDFDVLDPERLREQMKNAKAVGCKYFVVDAGWFGEGEGWFDQVGDWRESGKAAFHGEMRKFADEVRETGMGFGLWMEPERAANDAGIVKQKPEWFLKADRIMYDLTNTEVEDYLLGEIKRLVTTYGLTWMKVDFNLNMGKDPTGCNFYRYYLSANRLMKKAIKDNPQCVFEGCASGGLRTDIENTLGRYRQHFISDTVDPVKVLRMRQNGALRILPQYLGSWIALHETKFGIGTYLNHNRKTRTKLFACADATWDRVRDVSAEFTAHALICGCPGITGDLASLSEETLAVIKEAFAFYDKYRELLSQSICHLLTKTTGINDESGWGVLQYENIDGKGSAIYAYRLQSHVEKFLCYPKNMDSALSYNISFCGGETETRSGSDILSNGIEIDCSGDYHSQVLAVCPAVI